MCCMRSDLTFEPSFKVKWVSSIFKGPKTHLLLILEVWDVKPTHRKSYTANLFMLSDLTFDHFFKVKQGQPSFNGPKTHLLLLLQVWDINEPIGYNVLWIFS